MGALIALAREAGRRLALASGRGIVRRTAVPVALGGAGSLAASALFGDDDRPRRRRRKQVLTASDRADIAFIAGSLGKPAGRDFAMIVAARR